MVAHPSPPQIRTCRIPASGSSSHVATSAVRVVPLTGLGSQCTWPVSRPRFMRRCLLPSPGSLGWFPWIIGTTRRSEFLTVFSPRFVSFAWRYLGAAAFRPRSAAATEPADHSGVCCTGCSRSGFLQGTVRISHVPVKPVRSFAMFLRPRCDQARLWVQV